jgi:N-methylhydantoinase A
VVGVDVGGTFTDCALVAGEKLELAKLPTTVDDESRAVLDAVSALDPDAAANVVHGTTVATNALIARKGARTAFIATEGFRDLLLIGRGTRPRLYDLEPLAPLPLVPAELCFEAPERLDSDGWTIRRLSDEDAHAVADAIAGSGAESVAVCLLFSFLDDAHEVRLASAIRGRARGVAHVSLSSEVLPVFREFERAATTVANAYVAPLIRGYLRTLEAELAPRPLAIMASHGGTLTGPAAQALPAATALSGPAAGVMGAWLSGERAGRAKIISYDMGGTSTDVALCDGRIPYRGQSSVGGWPIALPGIAIETVGAGGGSLVEVDASGALAVGPASAGAEPGPAAYGRGGVQPTVTDALTVVGRLPDGLPLAGGLRIRADAARAAFAETARRAGLTVERAALGAIDVANAAMERALRTVSVTDGHDPADFCLVAFGGAGPLHACELASAIGVSEVLIPGAPGALSAVGLATAPRRVTVSRSVRGLAGVELDEARAWRIFRELAHRARNGAGESSVVEFRAEARYSGQSWELAVPCLPGDSLTGAFHSAHERAFGYHRSGAAVEVVTLRAVATVPSSVALPAYVPAATPRVDRTPVVLRGGESADVPVVGRRDLDRAGSLVGPALVTQLDATTWVAPGWRAARLPTGDLLLSPIR